MSPESQQKLKKLEKLAKVLDGGDVALLEQLDTVEEQLTEKIDSLADQIPPIDEVIARVKDGKDGAPGQDGKDGAVGPKGDRGEKGDQGAPGKDGKEGPQGPQGATGPKGDQGEPGKDGKDGEMGLVDEATIAYLEDKITTVEQIAKRPTNFGRVVRSVTAGSGVTVTPSSDLSTVTVSSANTEWTYYSPSATGNDNVGLQAAINEACTAGNRLKLAPGTYTLTTTMNITYGPDLLRAGQVGNSYRALKIYGSGMGATKINIGASMVCFRFYNSGGSGGIGIQPGVYDLSIVGSSISGGSTAIQVGGVSVANSDLMEQFEARSLLIDNVTSGFIFDDTTGIDLRALHMLRFKYGFEWGYNIDVVSISDSFMTPDQGYISSVAGTITSGSNVISGLFATTIADLQVGYAINAPGKFPAGCYVGSIGASSVTVVNNNGVAVNAVANGSTVSFVCGRVFNFGTSTAATAGSLYPSRGSTFVSPYWVGVYGAGTQGRISANNHYYFNNLINQVELITELPGNSHFNIRHQFYAERCNYILNMGEDSSTSQARDIQFDSCYLGQAQQYVQAPFQVRSTQPSYDLTLRNNFNDGAPIDYPWFSDTTYNYGRRGLIWENNGNLQSTLGYNVTIGDTSSNAFRMTVAGSLYTNSAKKGDAIETRNGGNWHFHGQDGMAISLAGGSVTLQNPLTYSFDQANKTFTLYVTCQSGNTLTLGSNFKKANGTAVGVIGQGTTAQLLTYNFIWNGTDFIFLEDLGFAGVYTDIPNQRIGIGATTPSQRLTVQTPTVNAGIASAARFVNTGSGAGTGASIGLGYADNTVGTAGIKGYYETSAASMAVGLFAGDSNTEYVTVLGDGRVGVGATSPVASAKLQVDSTTQGFLPPRMTTTQKNNISSPQTGLVVYDTTLNQLFIRTASSWDALSAGGGVSDGDKGDITVSGSGSVWNIDAATIGLTELSATGTPSASTYLRGDNTWASVSVTQPDTLQTKNILTANTSVTSGYSSYIPQFLEVASTFTLTIDSDSFVEVG